MAKPPKILAKYPLSIILGYLNNLTIDGYTSLSQNSWKSLTHLDIGRLEPIELFGLIGPGWTSKADLKYRMDDWGFVRGF